MTVDGDPDLAAIGRLLADPTRCAILLALDDGRAWPSSALAERARVAGSTASEHLSLLHRSGLVVVEPHGRHRYYRLAGPAVGRLLEALGELAPRQPIRTLRADQRAAALRAARTCYDHLAGRLGVALMAGVIDRGWLQSTTNDGPRTDSVVGFGHDVDYRLTATGRAELGLLGVELPPRRAEVRYCVDWTEQSHHLAGGLGAVLLTVMLERGWLRRAASDRAVVVTDLGRDELRKRFGIDTAVAFRDRVG